MEKRGPLYVLICYLCWGLFPIYWKSLSAVNSVYVLCARIVLSLAFIALVLAFQKGGYARGRAVFRDRREWLRLSVAGVFICVNWGAYIWSVGHGYMLDSSLAYYLNPILAILLGVLVFHERLSRLQWLAVAVTFTGLVITIVSYRQIPWLALVIGGTMAGYGAVKKGVRSDAATAIFMETLTLAPFCLAAMVWMEVRGQGAVGVLHGWGWVLLLACGVMTTIPLLFYAAGIRYTSMSLSGILMYVNPTLQFLVSVLLYGEAFTTTYKILFGFVWTGLVLYLAAGALQSWKQRKENETCA